MEDDERPGIRVETLEGATDGIGLTESLGGTRRRELHRRGANGVRHLDLDLVVLYPPATTQDAATGIHQDLGQPCIESGAVAQAWQLALCEHAGVLERIAGVGFAAGDGHGRAEEAIEARRQQDVEGVSVSGSRSLQQVAVAVLER